MASKREIPDVPDEGCRSIRILFHPTWRRARFDVQDLRRQDLFHSDGLRGRLDEEQRLDLLVGGGCRSGKEKPLRFRSERFEQATVDQGPNSDGDYLKSRCTGGLSFRIRVTSYVALTIGEQHFRHDGVTAPMGH